MLILFFFSFGVTFIIKEKSTGMYIYRKGEEYLLTRNVLIATHFESKDPISFPSTETYIKEAESSYYFGNVRRRFLAIKKLESKLTQLVIRPVNDYYLISFQGKFLSLDPELLRFEVKDTVSNAAKLKFYLDNGTKEISVHRRNTNEDFYNGLWHKEFARKREKGEPQFKFNDVMPNCLILK